MQTPLHPALVAAGARLGEFGGTETAASFGGVAKEFAALRSGGGVYDLGRRAQLVVSGNDRVRWMNGMVTNNIRDLQVGRGTYNFLLNAQGHILADMYIYNRGEALMVDTDVSQSHTVLQLFDKYIIMDEVEVSDASGKLTAIGLAGPEAAGLLKQLELNIPAEPLATADTDWQGVGTTVIRKDTPNSFEVWLAPANAEALWNSLVAAGATPVGYEALELARVADGIPRFGVDIREKDLPQETAQERALNFNKGCYLGQEIVERIHARGAVHRSLAGFEFTEGAPQPGAKITAAGKDVGLLTSVAQLPNGNHCTLALGYIRREAGKPGSEVEAEGAQARVSSLPFAQDRTHR
ncbi:MAG: aminomethyl transferase family protein [Candidatus Koribacter versatilis]|uniref:Aminomethyl transferase family protein n=1 Tax=Candidatus Korobacter versatilis TaxID=658062 RepID=A0A932AA18_9BACT|nr:aminomethyl transferase family protein [Candidatus Koribacter versatilis]